MELCSVWEVIVWIMVGSMGLEFQTGVTPEEDHRERERERSAQYCWWRRLEVERIPKCWGKIFMVRVIALQAIARKLSTASVISRTFR